MTDLAARLDRIRSDRQRGASELLDDAIALLRDALAEGAAIPPLAKALVEAQPSMASMWTAAAHAITAQPEPERFDRFVQQVAHAPRAMARHAVSLLVPESSPETPLRLVTISFSRSVLGVLDALRTHRPLRVACAEGRPALEGRRLATALATHEVAVTYYSDAAIGHALLSADAVLVGADAMTPDWFVNKSGTRMLAAAAAQLGIPVYVIASRDKFVPREVGVHLEMREGHASDIWDAAPAAVTVRNPYFETIPLDGIASVITDLGVLGAALVADVCAATTTAAMRTLIDTVSSR
jgi:ribose 1,5-bisphosphate isomerase